MSNGIYVTKKIIDRASLWKDKKPLLTRLDIELTERCNNNCIHCYINLPADDALAKERELSTKEIEDILREAALLGCMRVRFTGGEPLLRQDFPQLYIFARKLGIRVMLFTNATLITSSLAELFSRIPPLEKIEVSVYGMRKSSYEAVTRVSGSYAAAWRGINLLLEHKITFVAKGVLLPANKTEADELEAWAATIPGMDKPASYMLFFDLHARRNAEKNAMIRSIRLSPQEGLEFLRRREDRYLKEMQEFCAKFSYPAGDKLFSCGSGMAGGCVDAYGNFQPCMMLRHPDTVYALRQGSLKDALTNFFPGLRERKATNPEYLGRCAKCFLNGLCQQCPARSWMEHGSLDTPVDYFCQIAHTQARFFGLISEEERGWEVKDWQERIADFSLQSSGELISRVK